MALQGTGSRVNGWSRPFYLTEANYPITLSCWFKLPASSTTATGLFGLCGSNALAFAIFYGSAIGGSNDLVLDLYDDSGQEVPSPHYAPGRFTGPFTSDGKWHHLGFQILTNLSPPPGGLGGIQWVDGVRGIVPGFTATETGFNLGAQTFNTLQIGVAPTDGFEPVFDVNTAVAEICVIRRGTSAQMDATMAMLAQGASPLRIKRGLHAYHPLRNNFQDYGPQRAGFVPVGTPVAPVWVAHPPVDPPIVQFRRLPATHAATLFTGTAASADSASGVLSTGINVAGTGSSSDTATGSILASSLVGITQPTTGNNAIGLLSSSTTMRGAAASSNSGLGAFSTTQIPLVSTGATSTNTAVGSLTVPSIAANCQQLQNALVDALMRGQPFAAPGTWFIALVTQLGDTANPGIEVGGAGYARAQVDASLAAWSGTQGPGTTQTSSGTSGLVSNNAAISYQQASSDWGTVVGYEFWDQPTGGNRWIAGKLGTALTIHNGDTRGFPAGSLSIAMG